VVLDGALRRSPSAAKWRRNDVAQTRLAQVDAEGVGSHLETPRLDNVAYYQRFGYELIETLNPIEGAPTYYTMWRTPR